MTCNLVKSVVLEERARSTSAPDMRNWPRSAQGT